MDLNLKPSHPSKTALTQARTAFQDVKPQLVAGPNLVTRMNPASSAESGSLAT